MREHAAHVEFVEGINGERQEGVVAVVLDAVVAIEVAAAV